MNVTLNRYLSVTVFGLALIAAGCAAREVDVRSPVQGQATVEGDTRSGGTSSGTSTGGSASGKTETQTQTQKKTQSTPAY
jgi:hypothetical protein